MKNILLILAAVFLVACENNSKASSNAKDSAAVERQQSQYSTVQPVPAYDWSLERDLIIQLYNIRNMRALTHSVWRSDRGLVEGDCASIGFGLPYDTSLTNPLKVVKRGRLAEGSMVTVEQPEPNGIFASKNTSATWVMCAGELGQIEPVYVETKVTVYPFPVKVDYSTNRVTKAGAASVTITQER